MSECFNYNLSTSFSSLLTPFYLQTFHLFQSFTSRLGSSLCQPHSRNVHHNDGNRFHFESNNYGINDRRPCKNTRICSPFSLSNHYVGTYVLSSTKGGGLKRALLRKYKHPSVTTRDYDHAINPKADKHIATCLLCVRFKVFLEELKSLYCCDFGKYRVGQDQMLSFSPQYQEWALFWRLIHRSSDPMAVVPVFVLRTHQLINPKVALHPCWTILWTSTDLHVFSRSEEIFSFNETWVQSKMASKSS